MGRKLGMAALAAAALALSQASARAAEQVTATITPQQIGPSTYQYSFSLTDTGTTPIGTFWFGWFPAYDLINSPTNNFTSPSGWTGIDAPDVFGTASAQWTTPAANALQPGHTLTGFSFQTSETPAQIAGTSSFFGEPVELSYVYQGAPETDPGFSFVPTTVVPEPVSLTMLMGAPMLLLGRRRR